MLVYRIIIAVLVLFGAANAARSQVTVGAGQSWSLEFTSLAYVGRDGGVLGGSFGGVGLSLSGSVPYNGYILAVFEDSLSDPPIFADYTPAIGLMGIWQDLQGWIRLSVSAGEITVSQVEFDVWIPFDGSSFDHYKSVVVPAPVLRYALTATPSGLKQATFLWSTNASGYTLESAASFDSGHWESVTNAPVVVGSQFSITVDAVAAQRFFRLYKP